MNKISHAEGGRARQEERAALSSVVGEPLTEKGLYVKKELQDQFGFYSCGRFELG